jgi:serine phosphatase RsbU (regulator of sigma subunit)
MAAITRSTIHAFVHETTSPAEALCRANSVLLTRQTEFGSFATVFLAIIDLCNGDVTYSSAGHPPSLICHVNSGIEELNLGQMPLALWDQQQFTEHHTKLEPGDRLIMYTDGISEARRDAELLELEGIKQTISNNPNLSANELARSILEAAKNWAGGKLQDDAAVVVIER